MSSIATVTVRSAFATVTVRSAFATETAAIARARRAVDAAEAQVDRLRGWTTPRQADRYTAALRRLSAAVARWERVQPTV